VVYFGAIKIALVKLAINKSDTDEVTRSKITIPKETTLELLQIQRIGGVGDVVEFDIKRVVSHCRKVTILKWYKK
jgi:hypothetical protein